MARRGTIALISSQSAAAAHMVVMPIPAWGHIRPLCAFVARVVQMHPVYVTFLIAGDNVARVQAEMAQYFLAPQHRILLTLIRVVGLGPLVPLAVPHLFSMGSIVQTYQELYKDMLRGHSIRCAWTGDLHSAFPPPTLLILDICSTFAIEVTRSLSRQSIPLLAWVATPASSLIRLFSDESRGGIGDLGSRIYQRAEETGCRAEDVAGEVFRACDGSVVKIPGLPDHYDHEWFPQEPRSASRIPWVIHKGDSLEACDGAISITSEVYEPETTKAIHDWFSEEGKAFFGPGPLTVPIVGFPASPTSSELSTDSNLSSKDLDAQTLLDAAFEKYGMHSLIYIAFGSVFWPKESDHVWELISILLDLQIPFIFSHATICGDIPDDIMERVNESGIGLFLPWSPQQMILSHPATGWFLSHCGANSVLESLYQGVPLICWPQEGDQPANAAYVSTALNAGFELVQVRTGLGMRKLYRDGTMAVGTLEAVRAEFRDVLCQARGKSGEQKRMNAQKMGRKLADTWLDGGASQRTMARFVEKFLQ